jgi:hypothetical protein
MLRLKIHGGFMEFESSASRPKTLEELKEKIAELLFLQTTMEHDWESRKDWVKDEYRNKVNEVFKLIEKEGYVLKTKE